MYTRVTVSHALYYKVIAGCYTGFFVDVVLCTYVEGIKVGHVAQVNGNPGQSKSIWVKYI